MKALVLAGGSGTRLRPFSYSIPKQLMPVANRPVLLHCLESIRETGVVDVGVIVGQGAAAIEAAIGDGSALDLRITYIHQDLPRGLAHCVTISRDFLGDDDFLMYLGDNVLVGGIDEVADRFRANRPAAQLLVTKVTNPSDYGIAEVDADSRVLRLAEKPGEPRSDLALVGVYLFTPEIHEAVRAIRPSARGEYEITDAIQWLVEHDRPVYADVFPGYWRDTGQIDDLLDCNRALLGSLTRRVEGDVDAASTLVGEVVVESGARVVDSTVIGPSVVGAGTVVQRCAVGPYASVGRECRLADTAIENSILLDHASIHQVRGITSSVIGSSAVVTAAEAETHQLVIGDHTRVEVAA